MRRRALLAASQSSGGGGNYAINVDNYLTIEALEDGLTVSLTENNCEYCVNGDGNWSVLYANSQTPAINSGDIISFRGNLVVDIYMQLGIGNISISRKCNLKGNCMSLVYGDNASNEYGFDNELYHSNIFQSLFGHNDTIIEVSSDFLPATYLQSGCYMGMFAGCSSLVTSPTLSVANLYSYEYGMMYEACSNLRYIKMLAVSFTEDALDWWVDGVSSYGTFVKHKDAVIPRGKSGIPYNWTVISDNTILPAEIGNDEYGNKIIFDKLRTIGTSLTFNNEELKYVIQGNIEATVLTSVSYDSDKDAYILTNPNAFVVHYLGSDGKIFTIIND